MTTEIGALTDALSKASQTAIEKYIEDLNARGFAYPQSIAPVMVLEEYSYALSGVGMGALSVVRRKLRAGEYPNYKGFMPTPSEFSALARAEEQKLVDDLVRAKETLNAIRPEPAQVRTPEMIERVRLLREGFLAQHKMNKEHERRNAEPDLPFDASQNEYWLKIAALKDASGELNADQRLFRTRIFAKLGDASQPMQEAAE